MASSKEVCRPRFQAPNGGRPGKPSLPPCLISMRAPDLLFMVMGESVLLRVSPNHSGVEGIPPFAFTADHLYRSIPTVWLCTYTSFRPKNRFLCPCQPEVLSFFFFSSVLRAENAVRIKKSGRDVGDNHFFRSRFDQMPPSVPRSYQTGRSQLQSEW